MDIQFVEPGRAVSAKTAVVRVVFEGDTHEGALAQALAASRFTGAKSQTLDVLAPQGLDAARLVLVALASARCSRAWARNTRPPPDTML